METVSIDDFAFNHLEGKTAIITGGSNGIGAQTVRIFSSHGANVVVADLESTIAEADALIASLKYPEKALFIPTNTLSWEDMKLLFRQTIERFLRIDVVVANAGIMESSSLFDLEAVNDMGELQESTDGFRVLDVNLKGTINTLRLAMFHMQRNEPRSADGSRGSVVLITSTSGYFGSTGVGGYVTSKHGLIGLLRSSQLAAKRINVRVNAVAPFVTPTATFRKVAEIWATSGLKANTIEDVGAVIAQTSLTPGSGRCILVAGGIMHEMEEARTKLIPLWLGEEIAEYLQAAGRLFAEEGYPLPAATHSSL